MSQKGARVGNSPKPWAVSMGKVIPRMETTVLALKAKFGEAARFSPLIGMALIAVGLVLYLTREGAGASGDSVHYVMGARNLLAGKGYARLSGGGELKPITGFPPVFSIALAGFGMLGMDAFAAARVLNAGLFGANILLSGLLIYKASRSRWAASVGCLLLLVSANLIETHSWVMSEALYVFLFLLGVWALVLGIEKEKRSLIVVSGALAGAATLTRYAGISLLLGGTLAILLLGERHRKWRASNAALFMLMGVLPLAVWFLRNALASDTLVNRQLLIHSMDSDLVASYEAELIAWIFARQLPVSWRPRAILAALVAVLGPLYFWAAWLREGGIKRPRAKEIESTLPWLLGFYLAAYIGVLIANSLFLDAATTLSAPGRYLAPAYLALVILSITTTAALIENLPSKAWLPRLAAIALGGLLIALHAGSSSRFFRSPGMDLGYVGVRRDRPETVTALKEIEKDRLIISNNPEMVYILADRPAYILPGHYDPYSDRVNEDYQQQVERSRALLAGGGVLVMFGAPDDLALEAMEDIGVEPIAWLDAAIIYGAPSPVEG